MKKAGTFLILLLFAVIIIQAQDTIVGWTFPDNSADSIADIGITGNLNAFIITVGGTNVIDYKNGATTKAAQASGWDNGNGLKCWQIAFSTLNYEFLIISSKQSSGGNDPGPKDFKVQCSVDSMINWTNVSNNPIVVANDWTTGWYNNKPLPIVCSDQDLVFIRWIMNSDTASDSTILLSSGKSKIDDIFITGFPINNGYPDSKLKSNYHIYPNPIKDYMTINGEGQIDQLEIFNNVGMIIKKYRDIKTNEQINISSLNKGIYFMVIRNKERIKQDIYKIIKY